jgi:hypothetical protein
MILIWPSLGMMRIVNDVMLLTKVEYEIFINIGDNDMKLSNR